MGPFVRIRNLVKRFGKFTAVDGVDLDIAEGEFFTLLGPSGCGKTTTLRMLGGLEKPDEGEIFLGDRCLVSLSRNAFLLPEKREIGMVFQSYALWPHMTVYENVSYPLRIRRLKKFVIQERVHRVLNLVGLKGLENQQAPSLSGGQQQRVALARALVFEPRVLLLDEPLSNLDAMLRGVMRRELKALQRRVNVTMIFVTHDQVEALSLSERIGIMNLGRLEQVGTPEEVYIKPSSPFARDFLGKTFSLRGRIEECDQDKVLAKVYDVSGPRLLVSQNNGPPTQDKVLAVGQDVTIAIRPEKIILWNGVPEGKKNVLKAAIEDIQFLGDHFECTISLGAETHVLTLPASQAFRKRDSVFLELPVEMISLWPRG
jgi:ABC-type Fe3+/spermidine/putrescine transport system ATPase subunit